MSTCLSSCSAVDVDPVGLMLLVCMKAVKHAREQRSQHDIADPADCDEASIHIRCIDMRYDCSNRTSGTGIVGILP